jgi:AcrR family transcriptional regulator
VAVTRAELVRAGLDVVSEGGLDNLSMRTLADRLGVRAASLYWHVRDRDELVDAMAAALLDDVAMPGPGPWRARTLAVAEALDAVLRRRPGAADVLLVSPNRLAEGRPSVVIRQDLVAAGLPAEAAAGATSMLLGHVVLARRTGGGRGPDAPDEATASATGTPPSRRHASLTVENLSRGIRIVGAPGLDRLALAVPGPGTSASVAVSGDEVVVRRLRGAGLAEVRLDATAFWSFRVKGPAWRIRLDLGGVAVERIRMNGGARDVEVVLPVPGAASIPIEISGGASGIRLHRVPGTPASAVAHAGALAVRLDGQTLAAAVVSDWRWSAGGDATGGRIELDISGGAASVTLDATAAASSPVMAPAAAAVAADAPRSPVADLEILLDGIERRLGTRSEGR